MKSIIFIFLFLASGSAFAEVVASLSCKFHEVPPINAEVSKISDGYQMTVKSLGLPERTYVAKSIEIRQRVFRFFGIFDRDLNSKIGIQTADVKNNGRVCGLIQAEDPLFGSGMTLGCCKYDLAPTQDIKYGIEDIAHFFK